MAELGKRDTLKLLRDGAVAAIVLGGADYLGVMRVTAETAEQDFSLIGNGKPTLL